MKKVKTYLPTAFKAEGIELTADFKKEHNLIANIQRDVSDWVFNQIQSGKIEEISNQYITFSSKPWPTWSGKNLEGKQLSAWDPYKLSLRHLKLHPDIQDIYKKYIDFDIKNLNQSRLDDILWKVVENYKSFLGRNKKTTKRRIYLKTHKALNWKNGGIWIDNPEKGTIKLSTLELKKFIYLKYKKDAYNNAASIDYSSSQGKGGNVSFKGMYENDDNFLVIQIVEEKDFAIHDHTIGIDINKKDTQWITFSEDVFEKNQRAVAKSDKIKQLEEQAKSLNNDLLKYKQKYNSKQRNKLHKKKLRFERKLKIAIQQKVYKILDYFSDKYENKFNLSIDDIGFGAQQSFGQEYIREACIRWSKKNEVAFVICPPKYSSSVCPNCGDIHKQDRKVLNSYICKSCGHYHPNCDELGAENIAKFGDFLLRNISVSSSSKTKQIVIQPTHKLYKTYAKDPDSKKTTKVKLETMYTKALHQEFFDSSSR